MYRMLQNIGRLKYWRMPPYETFGGNKLANHQNRYNYIKAVLTLIYSMLTLY